MKHPQACGLSVTELEALCAPWPGVTLDIKWTSNRVCSVGGKMFALTPAEGSEGGRLSLKVADERFLELTDQPGIIAAPYLARARWISIIEPQRFGSGDLRSLVLGSYMLVRAKLPRKLQRELGPLPTFAAGIV